MLYIHKPKLYCQFLHIFLFSYHYFRILKLSGIEIDVHVEKKHFRYICYFNFSPNYTPISDICFYLDVDMETVAIKWEMLIQCRNSDDEHFWGRILVKVTIYRRLLIGRNGYLDQSEAYDIS